MFTRFPDVENAAVNVLHMSPDEVVRTRLEVLEQMLKNYVGRSDDPNVITLPPPIRRPAITEEEYGSMTRSEIAEVAPTPPNPNGIRQALSEVTDSDDPDLKGLESVLVSINVSAVLKDPQGLRALQEQTKRALNLATNLEDSIRRKKTILETDRAILDEMDIKMVMDTVTVDTRQLTCIFKWIQAVLDDLAHHIKLRLESQNKFSDIRDGNCVSLCEKLHAKTVKMRALHAALSARCDCLQIPKLIEDVKRVR
jgi:hypothetical protein